MYNYILGPSEGMGTWELVPTIIFADWLTLLQPKELNKIYVSFIPFFVFGFWSLLGPSYEAMKILCNLMSKTLKNGRKITQLNVR